MKNQDSKDYDNTFYDDYEYDGVGQSESSIESEKSGDSMKKKKDRKKKEKNKKKRDRSETGNLNLGEYGSFIQEDKKVDKAKNIVDRVGLFKRLPIDPIDFMHYSAEVQDHIIKRYI